MKRNTTAAPVTEDERSKNNAEMQKANARIKELEERVQRERDNYTDTMAKLANCNRTLQIHQDYLSVLQSLMMRV